MRILLDVRCLGWVVRGSGRYALTLAHELARSGQALHLVFNSFRGKVPEVIRELAEATSAPLTVTRVPASLPGSLAKATFDRWAAPRACQALEAQIWHGPDFEIPADLPCPRVVTAHDASWVTHPELYDPALVARLEAQATALRGADLLVTHSHDAAGELGRALGISAGRILVCPLFEIRDFGTTPSPGEADAVRSALGLDAEEPFLLSVGAKEARKNLEVLLDAHASLQAARRPRLVFAGPPFAPGDPGHSRIPDLAPGVVDVGYLDTPTLAAALRQARALVVPSITEGFGVPVLEAMACGTPALVANAGSLPEVGGDACALLPAEDPDAWAAAMTRAVEDEAWIRGLGARGPARAAAFRPELLLPTLLEAYRSLVTS